MEALREALSQEIAVQGTVIPRQDNGFAGKVETLIPVDSPLHRMKSLEEVQLYVENTVLTGIDEKRKNAVLGEGNPRANLVIIGEAPGAEEDRTGRPFAGRAGQLLTKILAAIRFSREEVYITNILKSRPPNNRDPRPLEIAAHLPVLCKQLAVIRPVVVLCVGRIAGSCLLGMRSSLGAMRGKIHDFHGIPLVVTYHPAALLRNPQWKRRTWEDVQMLRRVHDEHAAS